MKLDLPNIQLVTNYKPKSDSTVMVDFLKRMRIPGNRAAYYCTQYPAEYILRKYLVTEYKTDISRKHGDCRLVNPRNSLHMCKLFEGRGDPR